MFSGLARPLIIAHRGASLYAPENTIASFELAICQGADGIELDAKLCADNSVVVIHDQTVDRTTSGSGNVANLTLEELQRLDAGSFFDITYKGEKIPTLDQVLTIVGDQIKINVELTNYSSPFDTLPNKVAEIITRHNLVDKVLFSSFNPISLRRIHRLIPEAPIGLLTLAGIKGKLMLSWFGRFLVPYQSIHPEISSVDINLINKVHKLGRYMYVYTVNQALDMNRLFSIGVDGIFTDDPILATKMRASVKEGP